MGRKTFQSISKPLKNRINIVITRESDKLFHFKDVLYTTLENLDSLLDSIYEKEENKTKKTFVIGGSEIYRELIDRCDTMYITEVYRPYSNPELIDPEKYTYFRYDLSEWVQSYKSADYVSSENSQVFFNYVNYIRK